MGAFDETLTTAQLLALVPDRPGVVTPQVFRNALLSGVSVVANNTERDALFPSPKGNERVDNLASGNKERYSASDAAWVMDIPGVLNDPEKPGAFQTLFAALDEGVESVALQILGDSTGNDTNEWAYMTAQWIATKYPNWTVNHMTFDDASQLWNPTVTIQTGTAGDRYVAIPGSSGAGANATTALTIPYADIPFVAGDIDVRVKVDPTTWTPGVIGVLAALFGAAGKRSWRFYLNTNGALVWHYSVDGTTLVTVNSSVVPGVTAGTPVWLRVVHDMTNVATTGTDISFYKSADGTNGTSWTLINTVTNAGALTGLFNPVDGTTSWEIGGRQSTVDLFVGKIYGVDIKNGIAGLSVAPMLPDNWNYNTTTVQPVFSGAPILTFVNASVPGAGVTYLSDSTRLPKMTPNYGQVACILSSSHNDNPILIGSATLTAWDAWLTAVKARVPRAHIVLTTQNPETSPAANVRMHVVRHRMQIAWAAKNGLGLVDAYRAFIRDGRAMSLLVDPADGIHPLPAGSLVWLAAMKNAMRQRL